MKLLLDATPMLGRRTGIGAYTANLVSAIARRAETASGELQVSVTTWSARGRRIDDLPPHVRQVGLPVPARALRAGWRRSPFPPVELVAGRCDVVHGTNFVSPPTLRAREVVTIHDLTYELHARTVTPDVLDYRTLVPRALARGAHVVAPSHAVARQVAERYDLPHGRVTATPLGVDPAWQRAEPLDEQDRHRLGLPARYLLFVGSLDPRKNLPALVAAHRAAREQEVDVPDLVLAGPAGRAEGVAGPGIRQTGWLEDADLRRVVAGCRALVLPSLDEGFGLPVIEALACGRPVLVSDVPALREVGGGHELACDPSVEGLEAGLLALLDVPDGKPERAVRRAWAAAFTWDRTAALTLDVYRAVAP
ncbi:glycosyltransferase family 4 protein [Miniimonas arenae]|uniref:glycosyltransferase family 4 protein n=1 Tax=Miniimonas arenae TaxID=676201 RepID=UPI0028A6D9CC|nr:glycosyltransferase family 1 protein [Miniimonas arenae]